MKYSVEMYVPKNRDNYGGMIDRINAVQDYEFISITDGTNTSSTEDFIKYLNGKVDLSNICLHVAYMTRGRDSVCRFLDYIRYETPIKKIFLVRGNWDSVDYSSIHDVIYDILNRYGSYFTLMSSFYPDGYDGYAIEHSVDYSVAKIAYGCEYLISQYTNNYSNLDSYKRQFDRYGLGSRLIPSVMPILDNKAVKIVESITRSKYNGTEPSEDSAIKEVNNSFRLLKDMGFSQTHIFTLNHIKFLTKLEF